jgi:hypothetical protein
MYDERDDQDRITHYTLGEVHADRSAVRAWRCDCCDDVNVMLMFRLQRDQLSDELLEEMVVEDVPVIATVQLPAEAARAIAASIRYEIALPSPGADGGFAFPVPAGW